MLHFGTSEGSYIRTIVLKSTNDSFLRIEKKELTAAELLSEVRSELSELIIDENVVDISLWKRLECVQNIDVTTAMFLSRNRKKSEKKSGKKEKGKDADLSIKVCKQNTNSRKTAGSQASTILISDQKIGGNQNKAKSSNTVEHCIDIRTISSHVFQSTTSHGASGSIEDIGNEEKANRRTYSLEQVSKSLDQVMASGKAILDALASVNGKECKKNSDGNGLFHASNTKNERDMTKRGTYDLGKVSDLLDASANGESSLVASLNDVSQESPNKGNSTSNIKRKTYELDAVSAKLDQSCEPNTSAEDNLRDLSQDASYDLQNDLVSSSNLKRNTYDLERIETYLDESLNCDTEQKTEQPVTDTKSTFNTNRRGTYDLTDVSCQLDNGSDISALLDNSEKNTANEQSSLARRNTYNLNDVSDLLDESGSGKSVEESLDEISSNELKRKTYDLTDINLELIEQSIDGHIQNNNTVTADKQPCPSAVEEGKCDFPGLGDSLTSESEKRNTYVLDDGDLPDNDSGLSETQNKLVDVLSEFGLDKEDGRCNVKLTPCQWIEQMEELNPSPTLTKPPTLSPLRLELKPKKANAAKENANRKAGKQISDDTLFKPRSQSVSGVLDLESSSEIQASSTSDSKTTSRIKSNSHPNLLTSTPGTTNVSQSESLLMDISPGIRNYLANKLGLSEEQCLAVHRRLSGGGGSETLPDATKLANRKTYSLDDVAHSLDIATSQGLPMTKVLDNLDTVKIEDETNVANKINNQQKTDSNSNNVETENTTVLVENYPPCPKPQTLDLESATQKSSASQNPRIANISGFVDGSPTAKVSPLDEQFKLVRKKAVYKPSAKLQSFSHLLGAKGSQVPLRRIRGKNDPLKRNTYTLESVAESLEKAQDAGVPMLDALKRLSGMIVYIIKI